MRITAVIKAFGYESGKDFWVKDETIRDHNKARAYCMKQDTRFNPDAEPTEFGTWETKQGARMDLLEAIECLDENGMEGVVDEHPDIYVKYHVGLEKYQEMKQPYRKWGDKVNVIVHLGPAGSGKTWAVYEKEKGNKIYVKDQNKWWDGYAGEEIAIIDEIRDDGAINLALLLKWMDCYECPAEKKGGKVRINVRKFYITTNKEPELWYPAELDQKPLLRRIQEIVEFTKVRPEVNLQPKRRKYDPMGADAPAPALLMSDSPPQEGTLESSVVGLRSPSPLTPISPEYAVTP